MKACRSPRSRSTRRQCPDAALVAAAKRAWDRALALGEQHGFRNAQVSVIAPTGTIGLVMDCDTTGIEPDFSLVKFKKLAGGGYFKIINQTVPLALEDAGLRRGGDRAHRGPRRRPWLARQGARRSTTRAWRARLRLPTTIERVEKSIATAFDIRFAFSRYTWATPSAASVLGLDEAALADPKLDVLARLGFSKSDIAAANLHACGAMTHRGRAAISSPSISRCSIVQIPVDEMARAACLRRVTYA